MIRRIAFFQSGVLGDSLFATLARRRAQVYDLEMGHGSRRSGVGASRGAEFANQGHGLSYIRIKWDGRTIQQGVNPFFIDKFVLVIRILRQAACEGTLVVF